VPSFYLWTVGILSIFYLGSFTFCGLEISWPLTSLVLSFLFPSSLLTFFCLLKERGLFLYLLTLTAGCAVTLFQRLSSEDLPYWALAFEGSLGEVLYSLLTWCVLHTLLCYSFVVVFLLHQTSHPTETHFRKLAHYIVLYYLYDSFFNHTN